MLIVQVPRWRHFPTVRYPSCSGRSLDRLCLLDQLDQVVMILVRTVNARIAPHSHASSIDRVVIGRSAESLTGWPRDAVKDQTCTLAIT